MTRVRLTIDQVYVSVHFSRTSQKLARTILAILDPPKKAFARIQIVTWSGRQCVSKAI